ncbi:MAG TPA: hypothetical protein VG815_09045 [Chloroflexota bacterium]|nr:hypothetical protein [Chloroflexota bacterium]
MFASIHRPYTPFGTASLIVVLVFALSSVAGETRASGSGSKPVPARTAAIFISVHDVTPKRADPSTSGPGDPNLAMVGPANRWNGDLFVFLSGTGGRPSCCRLLLRQAAMEGFHVIGLTYNNQTAVGARCQDNLGCYGTVRHNIFDGSYRSTDSSLPPQDGVEHRLAAVVGYLTRHHHLEGWGQFVNGYLPVYARMVFGGHSQGGGEAAFIGSIRPLVGVVTFSSPPDTNSAHHAATWLTAVAHGRTPLGRYIAFVHSGDPFYPRIVADWQAMGLSRFGPITNVDSAGPPYGHSHQLLSSTALPHVVLASHDSTAVSNATPLCANGAPKYAPVWRTMLDVAAGLPVPSTAPGCA